MASNLLETEGFASFRDGVVFEPFKFRLPDLRPHDILVKVLYCGLCRTDLFLAKEEWGSSLTLRPLVAGHEIIGTVVERGLLCERYDFGQLVGIGFISEACGECAPCKGRYPAGCEGPGFISTFSAMNIYRQDRCLGTGGFGKHVVINEKYALRIPAALIDNSLPLRCSLLCGGLVIWSSLSQAVKKMNVEWPHPQTQRRLTIGVVGLGTAGHLAAQIITAVGHKLVCISSKMRKEVAIKRLCPGADFVAVDDPKGLERLHEKIDILINCCPGPFKFHALLSLIRSGGTFIAMAIPPESHGYLVDVQLLARRRISVTGAFMGSFQDAEDLLEWISTKAPEVKSRALVLPLSRINEATEQMDRNDLFDGEHFSVVFDVSN